METNLPPDTHPLTTAEYAEYVMYWALGEALVSGMFSRSRCRFIVIPDNPIRAFIADFDGYEFGRVGTMEVEAAKQMIEKNPLALSLPSKHPNADIHILYLPTP